MGESRSCCSRLMRSRGSICEMGEESQLAIGNEYSTSEKRRKKLVSDSSIPYLRQFSLLDYERVTVDLCLGRRAGQREQVDLRVRAGLQNRGPYTFSLPTGDEKYLVV